VTGSRCAAYASTAAEGKATWPGRKQVFRRRDGARRLARDILTVEGDTQPGEPLLRLVMQAGRRVQAPPTLNQVREQVRTGMAQLPESLRGLEPSARYPVEVASALRDLSREADRAVAAGSARAGG